VEFFQDATARGLADERTYAHAFAAYDALGDAEGVRRLWDELKEKHVSIDRVSYGSLLRALANCGDVDGAMEGLRCTKRGEAWPLPLAS
jgi:hypothetical protein